MEASDETTAGHAAECYGSASPEQISAILREPVKPVPCALEDVYVPVELHEADLQEQQPQADLQEQRPRIQDLKEALTYLATCVRAPQSVFQDIVKVGEELVKVGEAQGRLNAELEADMVEGIMAEASMLAAELIVYTFSVGHPYYPYPTGRNYDATKFRFEHSTVARNVNPHVLESLFSATRLGERLPVSFRTPGDFLQNGAQVVQDRHNKHHSYTAAETYRRIIQLDINGKLSRLPACLALDVLNSRVALADECLGKWKLLDFLRRVVYEVQKVSGLLVPSNAGDGRMLMQSVDKLEVRTKIFKPLAAHWNAHYEPLMKEIAVEMRESRKNGPLKPEFLKWEEIFCDFELSKQVGLITAKHLAESWGADLVMRSKDHFDAIYLSYFSRHAKKAKYS